MLALIICILFLFLSVYILYIIFKKNNYFSKNNNDNNNLWNYKKPKNTCLKEKVEKVELVKLSTFNNIFHHRKKYNTKIIPHTKREINKISKKIFKLFTINLPEIFDWKKKEPLSIENPRNQGNCGGCYAFAFASVLGDRLCLKNKIQSIYPSSTYLLSLRVFDSTFKSGCDGGNPYYVYQDVLKNNEKLEKCWPFKIIENSNQYGCPVSQSDEWISPQNLQTQNLSNCCYNCCQEDLPNNLSSIVLQVLPNTYTNIADNYNISSNQKNWVENDINSMITDIKTEIITNGPVLSSFPVLENFYDYYEKYENNKDLVYVNNCVSNFIKEEIYNCKYYGGHAVVITGWGTTMQHGRKIDYWIVRNSWGESSNNDGYFKVEISNINNQDYWLGFDIPCRLIEGKNTYESYGGVEFFQVAPIKNLNNLIELNIFNRI